jgi:hypothetical protein
MDGGASLPVLFVPTLDAGTLPQGASLAPINPTVPTLPDKQVLPEVPGDD